MPKKQKQKGDIIKSPHDEFFKSMMGDIAIARDFLEQYLPSDFKELVDLSKIKVEPESFVEKNLKKSFSDIIYSVRTHDNEEAFVYVLVEAQSTPDYWISLKLWRYMLLLSERYKNKGKSKKIKLPLIAPIVLYHGSKKYDAPTNLWSLFTKPELAKKLMENHKLIHLNNMPDDEIKKKKYLGMFEYFLKHIQMRDALELWRKFLHEFKDLILVDRDKGLVYMIPMLWYTDSKVPEDKQEELGQIIKEGLSKEHGEDIMRTIAQKYMDEGKTEVVMNMLKQNLDIKLISQVTNYTIDRINKLKNKI